MNKKYQEKGFNIEIMKCPWIGGYEAEIRCASGILVKAWCTETFSDAKTLIKDWISHNTISTQVGEVE